jgi:hypothetical protein
MGREEEIRMIAYSLWVQDGFRRGKAIEHWLKAEAIWEQFHKAANLPDPPVKTKLNVIRNDKKEKELSLVS